MEKDTFLCINGHEYAELLDGCLKCALKDLQDFNNDLLREVQILKTQRDEFENICIKNEDIIDQLREKINTLEKNIENNIGEDYAATTLRLFLKK